MMNAVMLLLQPTLVDVAASIPLAALGDPAAVQQAWLENLGRTGGAEAAVGRVVAGKLAGSLALRCTRCSPRLLAMLPASVAASDPADVQLSGAACLPVEAVLRLDAGQQVNQGR
jgi:hypothetical protein